MTLTSEDSLRARRGLGPTSPSPCTSRCSAGPVPSPSVQDPESRTMGGLEVEVRTRRPEIFLGTPVGDESDTGGGVRAGPPEPAPTLQHAQANLNDSDRLLEIRLCGAETVTPRRLPTRDHRSP